MIRNTLWFFALLAAFLIGAACSNRPATLEERAVALDRQLMCPVCDGQTLDESHSRLAEQIKSLIREKLAAGESEDEIKQYLSDPSRYGLVILAAPPPAGFNMLLWLIPGLTALAGAAGVFLVLRSMRRRTPAAEQADQTGVDLEPYLKQVDEDLRIGSSKGT